MTPTTTSDFNDSDRIQSTGNKAYSTTMTLMTAQPVARRAPTFSAI